MARSPEVRRRSGGSWARIGAVGLVLLVLAGSPIRWTPHNGGASDGSGLPSGASALAASTVGPPLGTAPGPSPALSGPPALHVSLTTTPKRGPAPLYVTFSAAVQSRSPQSNFSFDWSFGDGSLNVSDNLSTSAATKAVDNRSHTYAFPGTYAMVVRVNDTASDPVAVNRTTVTAGQNFTATLNLTRAILDLGQTEQLNVTWSGGFAPVTVQWSGPASAGCPRVGPLVNCTPTTNGTKSMTAWVNDSAGSSVHISKGFLVNLGLTVRILAASSFYCNGGLGQLTGNYSPALTGGTAPYEYEWNFDDGSGEANESNVSHGFAPGRAYLVTLNVTDAVGASVGANSTLTGGFSGCAEVTPPSYAPPSVAVGLGVVALAILIVALGVLLFRDPKRTRPAPAPYSSGQAPPGAIGESSPGAEGPGSPPP